jgi:thiamine-monophosphate kinase
MSIRSRLLLHLFRKNGDADGDDSRLPGEFALIARYFAPLAREFPGAYGLLDDAAVITPSAGCELVAKTDAIIGGVHFLADDPAELVARKALRVSLSDLAAKGAQPRAYMLDLALPNTIEEDWVVGDAALGLRVLRGQIPSIDAAAAQFLVGRYRLPLPRVTLGPRLVGLATAALDVSDGLIADLRHICETSDLAAIIETQRVPLSPAARVTIATENDGLALALTGGDDYEILFTAPPSVADELAERRCSASRSPRSGTWKRPRQGPRQASR